MAREILKRAALPHSSPLEEADIVLVHLTHNEITPWVIWQMNLRDDSTYWGDYHHTLEEAETAFKTRCTAKEAIEYTDSRPQRG